MKHSVFNETFNIQWFIQYLMKHSIFSGFIQYSMTHSGPSLRLQVLTVQDPLWEEFSRRNSVDLLVVNKFTVLRVEISRILWNKKSKNSTWRAYRRSYIMYLTRLN